MESHTATSEDNTVLHFVLKCSKWKSNIPLNDVQFMRNIVIYRYTVTPGYLSNFDEENQTVTL